MTEPRPIPYHLPMNNKYPFYLTVEEYAEALNNAHLEYLKTTHRPYKGITQVHHIADLAVSSASFFESAYLLLDSISTTMLNKIRKQETERLNEYEQYIKDKKDTHPETKVASVTDDPLWHEALNPENKKKKKKFRK